MVYFREVLPNPAGEDASGEWIKIVNTGETKVDLTGWSIKDASGKLYVLKTAIDGKTELTLGRSVTGITLNNGAESLTLLNEKGETVDTLSYTSASDDEVIDSNRFIEAGGATETQGVTLQNLAVNGERNIVSGKSLSIIFIAVAVAVVFGVATGFLAKGNKNEKT